MPETESGQFPVRDTALMEELAAKSVQKLRKRSRVGPVEKAEWEQVEKMRKFYGITETKNPTYNMLLFGVKASGTPS